MTSEREKHDKKSGANPNKHIPKDAQVIMSIMKELGISDYEPRVINQLLEFTYRYVTCILDDAKVYTNHAKKKIIDLDDVKLASQMVLDKSFTNPPPRDVLLELARGRNIAPLPPIKSHCGLRLPPDRYCLIATNYKLKAAVQPKKMTKSALGEGRSSVKTTLKGGAGGGGNGAAAKRQNIGMGAKQQNVSIPKPVFKFSSKSSSTPTTTTTSANAPSSNKSKADIVKMEMDEDSSGASVKRKRDEDDFQIVG